MSKRYGNSAVNVTIIGGAANDTLKGGLLNDTSIGGSGDDFVDGLAAIHVERMAG